MAALVLLDDGCVVAHGGDSIGRLLGKSAAMMSRFRSGSAVVMEEAVPSEISLYRVLLSLPRDVAVLVAAAMQVGIEIGVDGPDDLAVVEAAKSCCEAQSLDGRFWDRVEAVEGLFGEVSTGAMTDAVMTAIRSVDDAPVATTKEQRAADDEVRAGVKADCQEFDPSLMGSAFQVAA